MMTQCGGMGLIIGARHPAPAGQALFGRQAIIPLRDT